MAGWGILPRLIRPTNVGEALRKTYIGDLTENLHRGTRRKPFTNGERTMASLARGSFGDIALSLLRAVSGLLFWQHGAQKLFGLLGGNQQALFSLLGVAGVLEFFGGLAILFGLFTRPVAFVLSGQMAVAYFMAHFPQGFWPIQNRGELAALYAFVFLFLFAVGGGSYSLDSWLRRKT